MFCQKSTLEMSLVALLVCSNSGSWASKSPPSGTVSGLLQYLLKILSVIQTLPDQYLFDGNVCIYIYIYLMVMLWSLDSSDNLNASLQYTFSLGVNLLWILNLFILGPTGIRCPKCIELIVGPSFAGSRAAASHQGIECMEIFYFVFEQNDIYYFHCLTL